MNAPLTVTSLVAVDVDPTIMDRNQETIMDHDQDEQEQWRVYTVLYKDVTGGGAFAPRHC
jgi:hypothetical protein